MTRATPRISVRVISLPSSVDRRTAMSRGLETFALPWRIFDAFSDARKEEPSYDEGKALIAFGRTLSRAEIGCFHSHYGVMKAFLEDADADWLLVFEDDLLVDVGFDYPNLVAYLEDAGFKCLRLYCRRWKFADWVGNFGHRQILRFRTDPHGIQSYLIDKRGASAILGNIADIRRPFDDELGRFWEHGVPILALFPFPVLEGSTISTLEKGREQASHNRRPSGSDRIRTLRTRMGDKLAKIVANLAWRSARVRRARSP